MKFEIGQDRTEVHFLIAYTDIKDGLGRFVEILGCPLPEIIIKVFGGKYTSLFCSKDLNLVYKHVEKEIMPNLGLFYKKIRKKFDSDFNKTQKALFKQHKSSWKNIESALLMVKYLSVYLPALRYFEVVAMRELKNSFLINGLNVSDEEIFKITSIDSYKSLALRQEINLLKIALKYYKKDKDDYILDLKKHTEKFNFVELHASTNEPLNVDDFEKRLVELFKKDRRELKFKLEQLKNRDSVLKEEKKQIFNKYVFNKSEKEIIKMLELVSEIKVKITDCVNFNFKIVIEAKKLVREWGIKENLFYLMYPNEIRKSCQKGFDKNFIDELLIRNNAVIWAKNNKVKVLFNNKAEFFLKNYLQEKDEEDVNFVKGTPAFKGSLKGRVKIVLSKKDFSKVKNGDILVASDTTPDYVPLFEKISGIITDEGGVICHAAIVAREMKIPCIVGTKKATKIFHDNDLVKMDVKNGIIKKIK